HEERGPPRGPHPAEPGGGVLRPAPRRRRRRGGGDDPGPVHAAMTEPCPLVTDLTAAMGLKPETLGKLHALRQWDPETGGEVPFKWPPLLRTTKRSTGEPIRLREYQKVAAHHLIHMPRFILGDAVGLGKTIDCIAAACYVRDRFPDAKVLVLATK